MSDLPEALEVVWPSSADVDLDLVLLAKLKRAIALGMHTQDVKLGQYKFPV